VFPEIERLSYAARTITDNQADADKLVQHTLISAHQAIDSSTTINHGRGGSRSCATRISAGPSLATRTS